MKRSSLIVIARLLLLVVAAVLLFWKKPAAAAAVPARGSSAAERVFIPEAKCLSPARGRELASQSGEVLQEIQTAVITYAPEGVKPIAAHLTDSDPEIRETARQGLVQLGEAGAIPMLREAARQLDETEAKACLEAVAFLQLPSWSETDDARAISAELSKPGSDP